MRALRDGIIFAVAVVQFIIVAFPLGNADLISIQTLALDISRGQTDLLYPGRDFFRNDEWVSRHQQNLIRLGDRGEPNWCFYPPLIPYIVSPLASWGAEAWRIAWGMVQLGLLAGFALLIARILQRSGAVERPNRILIFALVLGSYPAANSVNLGQTSLTIAIMIWWGISRGLAGTDYLRSSAVGIAAFLKPFLLLIEAPSLLKKRWVSVVVTLAFWGGLIILSIGLVGWSANRDYLDFLLTLGNAQTAYSGNQSLLAGILRLFTDMAVTDYGFLQDTGLMVLGRILAVLLIGGSVWVQLRARPSPILSAGLWISVALLTLPISWEHHLIFLLPVVAYLWTLPGTRWRVLIGAATILMSAYWLPFYGDNFPGRIMASFPLIGNLLVFMVLIKLLVSPKPVSRSEA